jgi:Holliday junction resolvase RusA-like endonuclease
MVKPFIAEILGPPVPLARPRFSRNGTWDPQKEIKARFHWEIFRDMGRLDPLRGPLALDVHFHMTLARSCSKKRRRELIGFPHAQKPDLSNLVKFIEDVMEGTLFLNDSQIVSIKAQKTYSENPKTVIKIWEVNPPLEE